MKIFLRIIIAVILLPIVAFALAYLVVPLYNNYCLGRFSSQLYNFDLPDNTKILEKAEACGKLNGNGNGMDFYAAILISSEKSLEELQQYYMTLDLKDAEGDKSEYSEWPAIMVMQVASSSLDCPFLNNPIDFYELLKTDEYQNLYAVVIFDGGYSAEFDMRGH